MKYRIYKMWNKWNTEYIGYITDKIKINSF